MLHVCVPHAPIRPLTPHDQWTEPPATRSTQTSKSVKIVNRSKTAVSFSLEECLANLRTRGVNLPMTHGDVYLRAAESTVLQLNFRPSMRLRPFTEDVAVRLAGVSHTLLQVSGACLGVEAKLANEQIAFGPVVRGSRLVKHVVISNTGDVGTKFAWNATQLSPHFSVVPTDGFLSPNQDLRLEVHFHPTELASEIRRDKMRCTVEGGTTQFLTLTGACVDAEQDATPVSFQTQVSESKPAFPLAKLWVASLHQQRWSRWTRSAAPASWPPLHVPSAGTWLRGFCAPL